MRGDGYVAFKIEEGLNPRRQPAGSHISSNATLPPQVRQRQRYGAGPRCL